MRIPIIAAILLLATAAFAEEFEIRVNRIEMGVAAPDKADGGRLDTDDDGDSLEAKSGDGGVESEDDWESPRPVSSTGHSNARPARSVTAPGTRAGNHNSGRSNGRAGDTGGTKDGDEDKNKRCRANGLDEDCDSAAATAVDHNTIRSNR